MKGHRGIWISVAALLLGVVAGSAIPDSVGWGGYLSFALIASGVVGLIVAITIERGAAREFADGVNRGIEGEPTGPGPFEINGVQLKCSQCGCDSFSRRRAMLNTWFATFLGLDWANREAHLLVCTNCSHCEWFTGWPRRVSRVA